MNKRLCLSRSHRLSLSLSYRYRFRNIPQEVVVQQFGDANQHGEVDALPLEHLVDNAIVAMDGFRKPPHRATLRLQLRAYHLTDMNFLCNRHKRIVNFEMHEERYGDRVGRNIRVEMHIKRDNGGDGFSLPLMDKEELKELRNQIDAYLNNH